MKKLNYCLLILVSVVIVSCNKASDSASAVSNFDKTSMLSHTADSLITPSFATLQTSAAALDTSFDNFKAAPSETRLVTLQNKLVEVMKAWQSVAPFDMDVLKQNGTYLYEVIGAFPINKTIIDNQAAGATPGVIPEGYDKKIQGYSGRGLYATEYLLFSPVNNNTQILTDLSNAGRLSQLDAQINYLKQTIDAYAQKWTDNKAAFATDNANDASSSINQLFNAWLKSYEKIKNAKVGIPVGKALGNGQIDDLSAGKQPSSAEAYYSGKSLDLIKLHWAMVKRVWAGAPTGWEDYLLTVSGGQDVITATKLSVTGIDAQLTSIPANQTLEQTINSNSKPVEDLFTKLVGHTYLYKSELSSKLGLTLTYSSGDGD